MTYLLLHVTRMELMMQAHAIIISMQIDTLFCTLCLVHKSVDKTLVSQPHIGSPLFVVSKCTTP